MSVVCLTSSLKLLCYVNKKETSCKTLFDVLCKNGKTLFRHFDSVSNPGRGTPYIRMIEMIVVFFSGCIRRYSNFRG